MFCFVLQDTVLFYLYFMRRGKRPAITANGSSNVTSKKGRGAGGLQTQLVNRPLQGLSHGGRNGTRGRDRRGGVGVEEEEVFR